MEKRSFLFVFFITVTFFAFNNYFFAPPPPQLVENQSIANENDIDSIEKINATTDISSFKNEKFYVLENEYQQIVFSNIGGAISEINLSHNSKNFPESVVQQISFDDKIEKTSSQNAYFPLRPYLTATHTNDIINKDPKFGGYTPLLRRSLKNESGNIIFELPHQHYAMNLVEADSENTPAVYQMTRMTPDEIEFTANLDNRKITKTFSLTKKAPYSLELDINIDGDSSGLYLTSGILEVELISGTHAPILEHYTVKGRKVKVEKLKLPKGNSTFDNIVSLWSSNSNGFFGIITDPLNENITHLKADQILGSTIPTRLTLIDSKNETYPSKKYPSYELLVPYKPTAETQKFHIFAGPFDSNILKKVDVAYTDSESGASPNFSLAVTVKGWFAFISEPFARFLSIILNLFHSLTNSWGIAIILLTFTLRLMLFPLNSWSFKSNIKLQKLGPKLKALQDKYKKDPKRLQMETALFYKNEKVNPFSSCLPMIIQIPFLMGMFDLLKSKFALRGASFIPGWIDNLTAPDVLFSWNTSIFFFGTSFHLLPFITGGLMFLQQKMTISSQDNKVPLTDQQKQMRNMGTIMPLMFIIFFYNMPSGLNIYWISSTVFGMLQQWLIMRKNNQPNNKPTITK